MELAKAQRIAESIVDLLKPSCDRIEIAGSIRRRKPTVHDIDIVCIPHSTGQLSSSLRTLGSVRLAGAKIIRVAMGFSKGIDLDLYIATPEIWATLLLIRTGSVNNNIRLCLCAKGLGMKLHADGSGLFKLSPSIDLFGPAAVREERIAGDTEESIYAALGLPYQEPQERE